MTKTKEASDPVNTGPLLRAINDSLQASKVLLASGLFSDSESDDNNDDIESEQIVYKGTKPAAP